jgi:hypothetical protein
VGSEHWEVGTLEKALLQECGSWIGRASPMAITNGETAQTVQMRNDEGWKWRNWRKKGRH